MFDKLDLRVTRVHRPLEKVVRGRKRFTAEDHRGILCKVPDGHRESLNLCYRPPTSPRKVNRLRCSAGFRLITMKEISMSIRKTLSIAALLLLPWCPVHAQSEGWYIGAGAGRSKAINAGACSDLNGTFDPGFSCTSNDTSSGWRLFAGYRFNPNLALEGAYVDLGTFKVSASGNLTAIPASVSGSDKASGFSFDAVGMLPLSGDFGLLGRAGIFAWTLDASTSTTGGGVFPPGSTATVSDKPSGASLDFGVGAKYDFNGVAGLRVEWQRFMSIGNDDTGKSDIDLISASLLYRFR
jgi:OOP family OmpA-OmpF porin